MRKAVIFDVWETLVPLPSEVKRNAFELTATALGTTPNALHDAWAATRHRRETEPLESYLVWLRTELSTDWTDLAIQEAMQVRRNVHGAMFRSPAPGAVALLSRLRQMSVRTAAISNCTSDVRLMLEQSVLGPLLEEAVLSAEIGVMKPNTEIFHEAVHRLGVEPNDCLYVGDGSDDELAGATAAGMNAILLDVGCGRTWSGSRIKSLVNVLDMTDF